MSVEKNDVDVSRLFTWGTMFELVGPDDEVESLVYMRLVGDEDLNKARVYALRKSAETRHKMKDETSDEHLAYIPRKEDLEAGSLVDLVALFSTREITRKAVKEVVVTVPRHPDDDAPLEEMEKYQTAVDAHAIELEAKRLEYITGAIEKIKVELVKLSSEELYKSYVSSIIDEFCEQASMKAFREATTFYGTFADNKFTDRYFTTMEGLTNLVPETKAQFISAYQSLEVSGEELKKLREVTR